MVELGFLVIQIDGMGTSNRSKAFHDVCGKNLAHAGFPDRVLWPAAMTIGSTKSVGMSSGRGGPWAPNTPRVPTSITRLPSKSSIRSSRPKSRGWGDYWDRKRADFFVRQLLHQDQPDWDAVP